MENTSNVQSIQLKLGQAFSQKVAIRQIVESKSEGLEGEDAKYARLFIEAYQNPTAHSFQFA